MPNKDLNFLLIFGANFKTKWAFLVKDKSTDQYVYFFTEMVTDFLILRQISAKKFWAFSGEKKINDLSE